MMTQNDISFVLDWVGTIGAVLTAFGVGLTWYQIQEVRKRQLLNELNRIFATVCKLPAPELESYKKVYEELFCYYGLDKQELTDERLRINKSYFDQCLKSDCGTTRRYVDLGNDGTDYLFPLVVGKKHWLRSNNGNLKMEQVGTLDQTGFDNNSNILSAPANRFLNAFQIESYPAFLASLGFNIWNATTFDLRSVEESGETLRLGFIRGSYFNYVSFYDLMQKEFYYHLYARKLPRSLLGAAARMQPKPHILRESVNINEVFNYGNRPVKLVSRPRNSLTKSLDLFQD